MEQLVENMDAVINERHEYTTQMRQANKQKQQKNEWLSARLEENRLRSEMSDDLLPEEDPVLSQVMENE